MSNNKKNPLTKREAVENYLNNLCQTLELMENEYDPYPVPQDEIDDILKKAHGLIHYVKYDPSQEEWHNFEPEGWLFSSPNNIQVESIYREILKEYDS